MSTTFGDSRLLPRFWAKVQPADNGCWNWTANSVKGGYGRYKLDGRQQMAHRVIYAAVNGAIAPGLEVDHKCRNTSCVNPDHMRLVTRKQNQENLSGAYSTSRSGVRGVKLSTNGRWLGTVRHNYKHYHVGSFDDMAQAEAAVIAKRNELFTCNDLDRALAI